MINVNLQTAKDNEATAIRRGIARHKLGVEDQPDTKLTIDKMLSIPIHAEEGLARRTVVMELNAEVKSDIAAAKSIDELKTALAKL